MILLWLLSAACHNQAPIEVGSCDPRQLDPGEVRVRRLLCGDEDIDGGGLRRGDWLLENHWIRVGVRDIGSSLSTVHGTGAGIVDFASYGSVDLIEELQPWLNGSPLLVETLEVEIAADIAAITVNSGQLTYALSSGDNELSIHSQEGMSWRLLPLERSWQHGQFIGDDDQCVELPSEHSETHENLSALRLCDSLSDPIPSTAERIELYDQESWLGAYPVLDGRLLFQPPERVTHIEPSIQGCAQSTRLARSGLSESGALEVDNCTAHPVAVFAESGEAISARFSHQAAELSIPPEGRPVPCQGEWRSLRVSAGPAYEVLTTELLPCNPQRLTLQRIWPEVYGLQIHKPAVPTPGEAQQLLAASISSGQQHLLSADEQSIRVKEIDRQPWHALGKHSTGLITALEEHWMLSFPWTANTRAAGKGALNPELIPLPDWCVIGTQQQRMAIISLSLLPLCRQPPDFVWLEHGEEAEEWLNSYRHTRGWPIGSQSWMTEPRKELMLRSLQAGNYSTGSGPLLITDAEVVSLYGLEAESAVWYTDGSTEQLEAGTQWTLSGDEQGWLLVQGGEDWALKWIEATQLDTGDPD